MKKGYLFFSLVILFGTGLWWAAPWKAKVPGKSLSREGVQEKPLLKETRGAGSQAKNSDASKDRDAKQGTGAAQAFVAESEVPENLKLSDEDRQMILNEHPKVLEIKIFEENEFLKTFKLITEKKALISGVDQEVLQGMLQDQVAITTFEHALASPMVQNNFHKEQLERMFYIDFFKAALEMSQNSSSDLIKRSLQAIIMADNLDPGLPLRMRKSIAAEKVELIQLLKIHDQASIAKLRDQAETSRHQKLLKHYLSDQSLNTL